MARSRLATSTWVTGLPAGAACDDRRPAPGLPPIAPLHDHGQADGRDGGATKTIALTHEEVYMRSGL